MTIIQDNKVNTLNNHYIEKRRIGTIFRMLNGHHDMIKRMLFAKGV